MPNGFQLTVQEELGGGGHKYQPPVFPVISSAGCKRWDRGPQRSLMVGSKGKI